jgi:hypothetical protein
LNEVGLEGRIVRRKRLSATATHKVQFMPLVYKGTSSYRQRIANAEWIFSRKEGLLLAATDTTGEMPGGMERLTHVFEYRTG